MRFLIVIFAILMTLALANGQRNCLKPCGRNLDPRCGQHKDGTMETFANPCVLQVSECQKGEKIRELHRGNCANKF
uniref:Kazal-like domain-containing protein n=1 Tax=Musca domestica TaxID=7370 RepID=A0A1I8NKY7_MUSDO